MSETPPASRIQQLSEEEYLTRTQAFIDDLIAPWVAQHLGSPCTAEDIYDMVLVPILDWLAWHAVQAGTADGESWARALGHLITTTLVQAVACHTEQAQQDTDETA
jgi:hypothetical protein